MSFRAALLPPFATPRAPILPLSHPASSPASSRTTPGARSATRRLSYGIKTRASRYSLPLAIGTLLTLALFFLLSPHSSSELSSFAAASERLHRSRSGVSAPGGGAGGGRQAEAGAGAGPGADAERQPPPTLPDPELSADELIAEDDLFWDAYTESEPKSTEETAAEAERQAVRQDEIARNHAESLRALVWWLAEGGVFPDAWKVPTKAALRKGGAQALEKLLQAIDRGDEEGQDIFESGWAEFANRRYRIVVFSKTYCPYSKNAKSILGTYRLSPSPFTIELDKRSDMNQIQTLLQRITGRRTVPNILLDFASIGGSDDITLLHSEGGLQRRFAEMGVI